MKYFSPIPGYFIGKRHKEADTLNSGLALPEGYLGGSSEGETTYRLVDITHAPLRGRKGIKKGDTVLIHELDKTPFQIDMSDRNIQVVPREKVMGVQDKEGNLEPVDDVVFGIIEKAKDTWGLIVLPDIVIEEKLTQEVLIYAVGPEVKDLKVGDRILTRKGYGVFFKFGADEVTSLAIHESTLDGILGVLENV